MKYARITPDGLLESIIFSDQEIEQGYADEFKPLNVGLKPSITGLQGIEPLYEQTETSLIVSYAVVENHPKAVNTEIQRLQSLLSAEDYKITKCQEYALVGEPLPYDMEILHTQRKLVRARINELQTLI